jgi:tRNA A37 threonylcarbamoyladenosine modification protein TsaB
VAIVTETIYFIYAAAGFRHPAIVSVIVSVDQGRGQVIVSVIVSGTSQIQNQEIHAQEIIVSVGKYPYFFLPKQ